MKYLQDALQTFVSFKWSKVRLIITFFFFSPCQENFIEEIYFVEFLYHRAEKYKESF